MAYPPDPLEDDAANATELEDEHPQRHNDTASAVNDLVTELGTNPSGASADVTARLTALDTTVAAKETPAGAQTKVDTHRDVAAPHSGHETPAGAQTKVDTHAAAADPHPGYLTTAEGNAAYEASGAVATHSADTTSVHGITDTADLVLDDDARLANDRTPTAHAIDGAKHTASGLTSGHVLRATGATTFAFGALQDADIPATIARDSELPDLSGHVAAADPHAGYRLESVAITAADVAADVATQAELDAHLNDATDAHDATAISFAPAGSIAATNVQAAIEEVAAEAGGGGVSDGDKGDITVSASGATWTVDNNAITLAKLADIATARIIGRVTASSGDPEELTAAQVKTLLALTSSDLSDVTAFVRTLLDDADAAAYLTTLGISAFIQTLLNDADAATARSTLGAAASGHTHGWGFPMTLDPSLPRSSDVASGGGANVGNYLRVMGNGTISKVGLRIGTQAGNISVAVYANSGAGRSSVPGTRLATSGDVACPAAGYAEVALDGSVAVAEGDWLAVSTSSASATFRSLVAGAADSDMALGAQFRQSAAHPLPSSPSSLVAEHGRRIVLVGVA